MARAQLDRDRGGQTAPATVARRCRDPRSAGARRIRGYRNRKGSTGDPQARHTTRADPAGAPIVLGEAQHRALVGQRVVDKIHLGEG